MLLVGAGACRGQHVVEPIGGHDHHAVAVGHDEVAGAHLDVADARRHPDRAGLLLRRPGQGDAGGEHGEAVGFQRVDVAHAPVDDEPGHASRLRCGREDLAPVAELAADLL